MGIPLKEFGDYTELLRKWLELNTQSEMVFWAKWATIVSGLGLFVSAFALICLAISLGQTRKSIRQNRETAEAQIRSYVIITGAESRIYDAGDEDWPIFRYMVRVSAEVCGQTPIRDLMFKYTLYERFQKKGNGKDIVVDEYVGGMAPGEKFNVVDVSSPLEKNDEEETCDHDDILDSRVAFYVEGEISYFPIFSKTRKRTTFAFELGEAYNSADEGKHLIPRPIAEHMLVE